MKTRFVDLSNRSELDDLAQLLVDVTTVLRPSREWFILGATARDLLLVHALGMEFMRATRDLDIAIAVESWRDFEAIRSQLGDADRLPHRVMIRGQAVDILPFGGVEKDHKLTWPPDHSVEMSVLGFREAALDLVRVALPRQVVAHVASPPGQTMLKLIAWDDRRFEQKRHDALDLRALLTSPSCEAEQDDLYSRGDEFLRVFEFDPELAGAALLGADVKTISSDETFARLKKILAREGESESLYFDMGGDADRNERLVKAFGRGLVANTNTD